MIDTQQYMIVTEAPNGTSKHEHAGVSYKVAVDLIEDTAKRYLPQHVMRIREDVIVVWEGVCLLKIWACKTDVRRM